MSSVNFNPDERLSKIEARVVGKATVDPNRYVDVDHARLIGADYSGCTLDMFGSVGSRFERCRFENARIDDFSFGAGRELSEYVECSFDGARVDHMGSGFARFVRCSFRNVDLRDWICFKVEFIDCFFSGRLRRCIFNGTPLEEDRQWLGREQNEFHGNDFSGAELIDVAFRSGIDLEQQRLPSGTDYLYIPDAAAAVERARRGLENWMPDTELQRKAFVIVNVEAELVKDGQHQLLLRLPDLYANRKRFPREVVDKVVELFKGPN